MAKRTKAERQKSARKAARTRAKNEACKTGGKKPKAAKKGVKKAAKKPKGKRSAKQKANDKRLGKMAKARAKKGGAAKKPKSAKKGSKPKKPKGAKRGGAKPKKAAKSDRALVSRVSSLETTTEHLSKVQNADHKVLTKHSRQLSTIGSTERKMKQILGAKGLSAKSALPPKVKASIGKQIKLETKKAVAKIKDATEAANAAKYG